jgi:hypothetical protein
MTRRERVARNGFWLVLPVLVANIAFAGALPASYASDQGVPGWLLGVEWVLRIVVFAAPLLLTVRPTGRTGRLGVALYIGGLGLYVASWVVAIVAHSTGVAVSPLAATAPYWTPGLFLAGLALMSRTLWYLAPVAMFTAAHTAHGMIVLGPV